MRGYIPASLWARKVRLRELRKEYEADMQASTLMKVDRPFTNADS
jgi:hypothetical protein